ncbi:hypothetical protein ACQKWADRAFT_277456 [Trichoderma austrokoningii]
MGASSESPVAKPDQHEAAAAPEVDLAQALRELSRGEQTATAMEANLTTLESKLDALLAAFEQLEEENETTSGVTRSTGKEEGASAEQK